MSQRHNHRKGFSLVEAAIVLGVVGLVVGGIWVSAAKFYEDYKVNKTVNDITLIVKKIQGLISIADDFALGNLYVLTNTVLQAGAFPKDWIDGSTVKNPFGGNVMIQNFSNPSNPRFDFRLYNVPTSACIQLISKVSALNSRDGVSGNYSSYGLGYIQVYNDSTQAWATSSFPVTPDQAESGCKTGLSGFFIVFTFGYTRIN